MSGSLPALGGPELVIILLVVIVLFGGARLANIGKSFGAGLREFKNAVTSDPEPKIAKTTPKAPPAAKAERR
jgi:sec-independent protein translocase protein TatA